MTTIIDEIRKCQDDNWVWFEYLEKIAMAEDTQDTVIGYYRRMRDVNSIVWGKRYDVYIDDLGYRCGWAYAGESDDPDTCDNNAGITIKIRKLWTRHDSFL